MVLVKFTKESLLKPDCCVQTLQHLTQPTNGEEEEAHGVRGGLPDLTVR